MEWQAKWICPENDMGDVAPLYEKMFELKTGIASATLHITALGVYEAILNGSRVGEFVLAPGWTSYRRRLQYQSYDVTGLLTADNALRVTVGKGWYRSRMPGKEPSDIQTIYRQDPAGLLAQLDITYQDGHSERITTDESWNVGESAVRFSEIYDGETYDASMDTETAFKPAAVVFSWPLERLIPQQGEDVCEKERVHAARIFTTPKGEVVIDFGQNITGYVETSLQAHRGDKVELSHAEVMDQHGNFYRD